MTLSNVIDSSEDEDDVENEEIKSWKGGTAMCNKYLPCLACRESPNVDSDDDVKNSLLVRPTSAERTGSAESSSSSAVAAVVEVVELIDEDRTTVQG